jgi:cell filamentation protein
VSNYTYRGTHTVKNTFGVTDYDEFERIEAAIVKARYTEIAAGSGPTGQFDGGLIKAFHRHLFQDVYEWAGRTRDERVALSDGTVATMPTMRKAEGKLFTVGPAIPVALDAIGEKLRARSYLRSLRREEFAKQAGDIMAEINTVHPFREGNGRTQRVFMEQLAHAAGHDLNFTVISKERMIQASIAAHERNDTSMMRRMFDEISDPERVTLLRNSIAALEKSKIDWNNRYVATIAPGHSVELVFAGISGEQFMARTKSDILFGWVSDLPTPYPQRNQTFTLTRRGRLQQKSSYRS